MNVKEIVQAWYNKGFGDEEIQAVAKARREICNNCLHKTEMIGVEVCGLCHCPLAGKTFSPLNSCPAKKWIR